MANRYMDKHLLSQLQQDSLYNQMRDDVFGMGMGGSLVGGALGRAPSGRSQMTQAVYSQPKPVTAEDIIKMMNDMGKPKAVHIGMDLAAPEKPKYNKKLLIKRRRNKT